MVGQLVSNDFDMVVTCRGCEKECKAGFYDKYLPHDAYWYRVNSGKVTAYMQTLWDCRHMAAMFRRCEDCKRHLQCQEDRYAGYWPDDRLDCSNWEM